MLRLRIKEVAEAKGLNRSQLQRAAGVTLALLDRYWKSTTSEVRLSELEKIAKALGVKASELITDDEEQEAGQETRS
jgi:transcriptional regulator with XRE-family HTH domain